MRNVVHTAKDACRDNRLYTFSLLLYFICIYIYILGINKVGLKSVK